MRHLRVIVTLGGLLSLFILIPELKEMFFSLPSCEESNFANRILFVIIGALVILYIPILFIRLRRRSRLTPMDKIFDTPGDRLARHPVWLMLEGLLFSFLFGIVGMYVYNLTDTKSFEEEAVIRKKYISTSTGKGGPAVWYSLEFYSSVMGRDISLSIPRSEFELVNIGQMKRFRLKVGKLGIVCGY